MVEVTRQQGFARAGDEDDDDEHRVREWEDGLPSLADLISLSQCLISPQLASAFSITSPSAAPLRSSADVALASHAAFSSLCASCNSQPDPSSDSQLELQRHPPAGDGHDRRRSEDLRSYNDVVPSESFCDDDVSARRKPLPPDVERNQDRKGDASQDHFTAVDERLGMAPARFQCLVVQGDEGADITERNVVHGEDEGADITERNVEHDEDEGADINVEHDEGEDCAESNVRRPCPSEGSDIARRVDVDVETEEAESTPSASENPSGEAPARTLKRPRLVWTPELHKRFVDAVAHLGLRTAVPKSIMQLMNVEGLTRENVASHLQKYRLYLKRMQQGLAGEGPTGPDHIFASTPLPGALATSGRFPPPVPAHLQDVNQVPFLLPPGSSISINRGHVAGVLPGPLAPIDPYSYSAFARPAHRVTQQNEFVDVHRWRQHQSDPNHSVLRK